MKFRNRTELMKWALAAQHLWLFLDYDGTLAEFAPTPEVIEANPKVINALERLVHISAIRLTVLSGRRLGHVRLLVPIPEVFLAGTYGVELLTPESKVVYRTPYAKIRPVLEMIKPQWEQIIDGQKDVYIEDKGWALALHARFADDKVAEQTITQAQQVIRPDVLANGFRILSGHKFLEIAPQLASKRETVAYLLRQYPLPGACLLYIGDDDKDEEAFPLIRANHGVTAKVFQPSQASQPTAADFFFESPEDTLQWLKDLAELSPGPLS
jgi:trehalose 6-phosphate phosphatase